jgi:hypothetical protein
VCSKQIITTQKQYDFLESLTAEIPLPPSRPSTPPPQGQQRQRRRKQSPSAVSSPSEVLPNPKRKRRSPQKNTRDEDPQPEPAELKSEALEIKSENEVVGHVQISTQEAHEHSGEEKKRGWFDIVMGSNADDSSEDDGQKKRKYYQIWSAS